MTAREWHINDWRSLHDKRLPPDFTQNRASSNHFTTICYAGWLSWLSCTRRAGHTGRHAAGTGEVIIAVWENTP